ncbi:MAG: cob(I)yrinic acid a,c-diamide adenosyltransferase [Desulfobacterales bacterium]
MAVRAAGHGLKTYVGQFMKGWPYGELSALKAHPLITIEQYGMKKLHPQTGCYPGACGPACQGLEKIQVPWLRANTIC